MLGGKEEHEVIICQEVRMGKSFENDLKMLLFLLHF